MNDVESPDVFYTLNHLLHYQSCFFLAYVTSALQEHTQVVPICILLHHINIWTCLNGLVQAHGVITSNHTMDLHFFMDTVKIFLANIAYINYFTSIDPLGWVYCRSHSLLFATCSNILKEIFGKLSLADLSILAHTEDIIQENDEVVDFSDLGLFLSSTCIVSPTTSVSTIGLRLWSCIFSWHTLGVTRNHPWFVTAIIRRACHTAFSFDHCICVFELNFPHNNNSSASQPRGFGVLGFWGFGGWGVGLSWAATA